MSKTLFMFTHNYPNKKGDSVFIASEITFLCKKFDKVVVICLSKGTENQISVPNNCNVYFLSSSNKIYSLLKVFVSVSFWKNIKLLYEELKDMIKSSRISIYNINSSFRFYLRAINICDSLKQVINKEKKPNIFYSFWAEAEVLSALLINKRTTVCTRMHRYDLYEETRSHNYQPFKKVIDRRIDRCYFISQQGLKYYLNKFATRSPNNYKLFYLGSFSDRTAYTNLYLRNKIFELVSVSDVRPFKRVEMIIDALTFVDNKIKIKWTHFGDGSELKNIKTLANEQLGSLDNISFSFAGYIHHEQLLKFLESYPFHCLINTSSLEGLPVSMMESLSFSIPVIAPNVGGISEIVNDSDGILLPVAAEAKDFAVAIEKIATMSQEQYEQLRKGAFSVWNKNFNGKLNYMSFAEELYNNA